MNSCADESLARLIYLTSLKMKNLAEKILNPFDLTLEQFQILKSLLHDSGLTQRQIGEKVKKKPTNITRILDRLELKELVMRCGNPDDRRASLVFLTEKGTALTHEVYGKLDYFSQFFVEGISKSDQQIVRKAFARMSENIDRLEKGLHGDLVSAARRKNKTNETSLA